MLVYSYKISPFVAKIRGVKRSVKNSGLFIRAISLIIWKKLFH